MSRLAKACLQFIEHEAKIKNADTTKETLTEKYVQLLEARSNVTDEEAEVVYSAYKEIIKHDESVEKSREKKAEAEEVIREYLEAMQGKTISYTYESGIVYPTYVFRLNEKGEVTHNHQ